MRGGLKGNDAVCVFSEVGVGAYLSKYFENASLCKCIKIKNFFKEKIVLYFLVMYDKRKYRIADWQDGALNKMLI